MFRKLRPTGNKIYFKSIPYSDAVFSPYNTNFFDSGTSALSAVLLAVKNIRKNVIHPKILLPAYTCPDVLSAVLFVDIQPILIDFYPDKPFMNLEIIKHKLTDPSVIAIIAINFLGISEQTLKLKNITNQTEVLLIEDSAQGFPKTVNKNSHYWNGDFIISSFSRGKPLALLGGGIVLSKNKKLMDNVTKKHTKKMTHRGKIEYYLKILIYNVLSKPQFYFWVSNIPGLNLGKTCFKSLQAIQACPDYVKSLLSFNFEKYSQRRRISNDIHILLSNLASPIIVDLPAICNFDFKNILLRYPILIKDLKIFNEIHKQLEKKGLGASKMYKDILPEITGVPNSTFTKELMTFKNAQLFSKQLITLPTHEDVSENDLLKIKDIFTNILTNQ